jgi:hypothetical protein
MRSPLLRTRIRRFLLTFGVLAASSACYAQSCALCYTQAASSGSRIIQGLRSGILVLIIPPMFMSVGITLLAYRKRNQFHRSSEQRDPRDW